ncbi:hypothetical protein F2Q70_00019649 [Brassica cretica]|uniref:Uncharacterized protein n=1 Tax=Brassica cretica TaxID=69181 RepID=A0A8S9GRB5_BRACR|nr:hypothetical protein F2Q70_00019649 [Brassica cretica]
MVMVMVNTGDRRLERHAVTAERSGCDLCYDNQARLIKVENAFPLMQNAGQNRIF